MSMPRFNRYGVNITQRDQFNCDKCIHFRALGHSAERLMGCHYAIDMGQLRPRGNGLTCPGLALKGKRGANNAQKEKEVNNCANGKN